MTYVLLLLIFFQKQSEELDLAAKEQVEAVNPGTNVNVSKDQFDSTVTNLNIVCSLMYSHVFFSASYAICISYG